MNSSTVRRVTLVDPAPSPPLAHSTRRRRPRSPPLSFFVEALYAFNGESTSSLSFQKGDIIEVLTQLPSGWWDGVIWRCLDRGWFPSNYVRRISDEEGQRCRAEHENSQPPRYSSLFNAPRYSSIFNINPSSETNTNLTSQEASR